jgi:hypothetical protein
MVTFLRKPAAIVTALTSAAFATAIGLAPAASAADSPCLWAGTGYGVGTVVTANGFDYSCHNDGTGAPFWLYYGQAPAGTPDNVPSSVDPDITSPTAVSVGAEVGWGGDF